MEALSRVPCSVDYLSTSRGFRAPHLTDSLSYYRGISEEASGNWAAFWTALSICQCLRFCYAFIVWVKSQAKKDFLLPSNFVQLNHERPFYDDVIEGNHPPKNLEHQVSWCKSIYYCFSLMDGGKLRGIVEYWTHLIVLERYSASRSDFNWIHKNLFVRVSLIFK